MNTTTNPTSPPARIPPQEKRTATLNLLNTDAQHHSAPSPATTTPGFLVVLPRVVGRPHTVWMMRNGDRGGRYSSWLNPGTDKFVESPQTGLQRFANANRIGKKWWQW